jgi:hypothetical protein
MDYAEVNQFMGMGGGNFLKLESDKDYKLIFKGVEPRDGKFGKTLEYTVIYESEEKKFSSGSKRLLFAIQNAKVKENDAMILRKTGEGYKTTFTVKKDDGSGQQEGKKEKEIDIDDINL